jgi:hypothetical protein
MVPALMLVDLTWRTYRFLNRAEAIVEKSKRA